MNPSQIPSIQRSRDVTNRGQDVVDGSRVSTHEFNIHDQAIYEERIGHRYHVTVLEAVALGTPLEKEVRVKEFLGREFDAVLKYLTPIDGSDNAIPGVKQLRPQQRKNYKEESSTDDSNSGIPASLLEEEASNNQSSSASSHDHLIIDLVSSEPSSSTSPTTTTRDRSNIIDLLSTPATSAPQQQQEEQPSPPVLQTTTTTTPTSTSATPTTVNMQPAVAKTPVSHAMSDASSEATPVLQ